VIVSGPKNAPPLVLLHGIMATSTMWTPNIADFSKDYRVYAIDMMGQPSKSIPAEPIRSAADFVAWLTMTLDALRIARTPLVGVSYGGWLAGAYAVASPERVDKLVLLSTGGLLPLTKQFTIRGMLMTFLPTHFTVNSCMHWLGIRDANFIRVIYLGLKHFSEPSPFVPTVFSDDELRTMQVPTLVLYGDHEVICDPAAALTRARSLVPDVAGELIPGCSHDMCGTQYGAVNARVLDFLKKPSAAAKPAA
jgi:pimeloyl-ACP methyl ester carboxylesterase